MIKIYELINQNSGRLVFNYCGVNINASFENGNTFRGKNAQLRTNDRFIQDAIEKDARFGVTIKLAYQIEEEKDRKSEQHRETALNGGTAPDGGETKKSTAKKSTAKKAAEPPKAVEFDTVNDFLDFLEEAGEGAVEPADMEKYLQKYNATIKE